MMIKVIYEDRKNMESIMEVIGCTRHSLDKTEKEEVGLEADGNIKVEEVTTLGQTHIHSNAGLFLSIDIDNSKHNALVAKFTGGTSIIATIKHKEDGTWEIS